MRLKIYQFEAPSTRAAWYKSTGMVSSLAMRRRTTNGVVFHTSTKTAAFSAQNGLPPEEFYADAFTSEADLAKAAS